MPAGFLSAYVVRFLAESRSRGVLRGLLASMVAEPVAREIEQKGLGLAPRRLC